MWEDMVKFMVDYATHYRWEKRNPPGRPVPTHIMTLRINNDLPVYVKVEAAVQRLRLNKAGGHVHLRAYKFKKWLE